MIVISFDKTHEAKGNLSRKLQKKFLFKNPHFLHRRSKNQTSSDHFVSVAMTRVFCFLFFTTNHASPQLPWKSHRTFTVHSEIMFEFISRLYSLFG